MKVYIQKRGSNFYSRSLNQIDAGFDLEGAETVKVIDVPGIDAVEDQALTDKAIDAVIDEFQDVVVVDVNGFAKWWF